MASNMIDQLICRIKRAAREISELKDANDFLLPCQRLERDVNQLIYLRTSECKRRIPPHALTALRAVLPSQEVLRKEAENLRDFLSSLSFSLNDLSAVYPPSRKSDYALYEKIVDGRIARRSGMSMDEKKIRAACFHQILARLKEENSLSNYLSDVIRARVVFSSPDGFLLGCRKIKEKLHREEWKLNEMTLINITAEGNTLLIPERLVSPDYIAVHLKFEQSAGKLYGNELQIRLAQNHWGPHLLKVVNGYLNKYMAKSAEEVDYSIDRLGLEVV